MAEHAQALGKLFNVNPSIFIRENGCEDAPSDITPGMFFIMTWIRERREESYVEWLISESGRREVFRKFVRDKAEFPTEGIIAITVHQYANFIQAYRGSGMSNAPHVALSMFVRPGITTSVAENVARLHLLQLEERGAVSRLSSPSLDTVYQVNHTVLAESQ